MSELKPCPFCGKKPNPNWTDESYIECTNRKCYVYGYGMSTGAWNTRPIEDALHARIAELEDQLEDWTNSCNILYGWAEDYKARIAELEADKERLNSCESALISMVNQFFYNKAGENIFRHSFMSAEEEAAEYLVEHGIARWVGKNKSAICFNEVQE